MIPHRRKTDIAGVEAVYFGDKFLGIIKKEDKYMWIAVAFEPFFSWRLAVRRDAMYVLWKHYEAFQ